MRALLAHDYGPPSLLRMGEAPKPVAGPGQLLVRMRAAALNPFDLKLLSGAFRGGGPSVSFPYVPGMDGAGFVAALGEGVEGFAVGEEVFGFFGRTPGTIAEYAVIDAGGGGGGGGGGGYCALRPEALDPVHAAALPESGVTAKTLLRAVGEQFRTLLVVGATGGIGMYVVQLAAHAGVQVLATAGPQEADYVRGLGAAHALDYVGGDPAARARELVPGGVDAVVDLVSAGEAVLGSARALRDGGVLASPLGGPEDLGRGIQARYVSLTLEPGDLEDLAARAASGQLRVEVSRVYPFEEAPQAFADFADGHTRGKLVVEVSA